MAQTIIRNAEFDEVQTLPRLLDEWTSGFIETSGAEKVLSSKAFEPAGCFIAKENDRLVGCVAVTNLPRKNWFVVRYLSAEHANSRIETVKKLLGTALDYVENRKPEFLRATTPSVQPFVSVYKDLGFKPVRRDFRMVWDFAKRQEKHENGLDVKEVDDSTAGEASKVFVESLHPYWDWRTEEEGGEEAAARNFQNGLKKGERWLVGHVGPRAVALYGLIPDYYETSEARFRGAFVLPDHRGKGYGSMMMNAGASWARKLGQRSMTVYTFSYLDSLAPGALLYVKSGGKIDSEYLQLRRAL